MTETHKSRLVFRLLDFFLRSIALLALGGYLGYRYAHALAEAEAKRCEDRVEELRALARAVPCAG